MQLPKLNLPLFIITAIGAVLRLVNIGYIPLPHMDETWTLSIAQYPTLQIIVVSLLHDFNPPLYYLAAHLMVLIGGPTVLMIRIPSFIAGVLLIPVVYFIGLEVEDNQLGLICAATVAILNQLIYFADYGRAYAMVGFVFAITILAFIRILKGKEDWIMFSVSGLIALYIHAFALVPLGLMVLYLLYLRLARWKYLIGMSIGAVPFAVMMYTIAVVRPHAGYAARWDVWFWLVGVSTPLELFGLAAPLCIVLIAYTLKRYYARYDFPLIAIPLGTCLAAIGLSYFQLIYAEYVMLILPMFVVLAVVPISEWIKARNLNVVYPIVIFVVLQGLQLMWWWEQVYWGV